MNILKEIQEEFYLSTYKIDNLVIKYLIKRLGVQNIQTIDALGLNGKKAFEKRLDLLMQVRSISKSKERKLGIYSKLYQAMVLGKHLEPDVRDFAFLADAYPQNNRDKGSKLIENILSDFLTDVQQIVERLSKIPTLRIVSDNRKKFEEEVQLSVL